MTTNIDEDLLALYLDFDGVLQDDDVWTKPKTGEIYIKTPGRTLFEWTHILERILADFPDVKIILSTSWVRSKGFQFAKAQLPATLQARVIGATFPEKYAHKGWFDRMTRFEQISKDVVRRNLSSWVAIDNDNHGWPTEHSDKLVLTQDRLGLSAIDAQNDLVAKLKILCSSEKG